MDRARWQQIEAVYQAAADLGSDERAAYLGQQCRDDSELRREVESLLRERPGLGFSVGESALGAAAGLLRHASDPDITMGTRLGPYVLERLLGEGGMGRVYLARDSRLNRLVAIKFLNSSFAERFAREARAIARLGHPNVCTLYDIGPDYLVMECVEGQTLAARIETGPLPIADAINILWQAAQALRYAHDRGVLHRDVKPSNIMLTADGHVKLMDFGLAKMERSNPQNAATVTAELTGAGAVLGTPAYMSPEQARGERMDRQADLWSLGVVAYEMLTGTRPFTGENSLALLRSIVELEPARLSTVRRDCPSGLENVVERALRKESGRRYADAAEMLADLDAVRQYRDEPVVDVAAQAAAAVPSRNSRAIRRSKVFWAVAFITMMAISLWYVIPGRGLPKEAPALAVLPLADISPPGLDGSLAEGLTDALITELGSVGTLRVISRTSVMRYKNVAEPLSRIAAQLEVHYILEGTVLHDRDNVRISARLIRAEREEQIWAGSYEREFKSVPALYRELAQAVANEITGRLGSAHRAAARPVNPQAYRAYLVGLQYWGDPARWGAARQQFERAITLDPTFAPAYASLAQAYAISSAGPWANRLEVRRRGVEMANKALGLDSGIAEAHNALAWFATYFDYDWPGALKAYRRALELNPSLADAHHGYAHYLLITGNVQEGLTAGRRAVELSPYFRMYVAHDVWALYMARQYADAARRARSVLEVDPGNTFTRSYSWRVYEQVGEFRASTERPGDGENLARFFALTGSEAEARRILAEMLKDSGRINLAYGIALVYTALRENEAALDWLEEAYRRRSFPLPEISRDARFDPLRSERRFKELLRRIGLNDVR
jgi:serine/threonine protein kinase